MDMLPWLKPVQVRKKVNYIIKEIISSILIRFSTYIFTFETKISDTGIYVLFHEPIAETPYRKYTFTCCVSKEIITSTRVADNSRFIIHSRVDHIINELSTRIERQQYDPTDKD